MNRARAGVTPGANEKSETRRWANSSITCTFSSAPTGTRTQTVRILSPLPLPIGLWGPRLMLETCPTHPLGRAQQGGRSGRQGQGRPRIAESNAGCFYDLVDRPRSATQTARVAVTVR